MMNHDKKADVLMLVGRVLMSIIFLVSGYSKIVGFAGTVAFVGGILPFPTLLITLAIIIELAGGVMLLFGYKTRLAAAALIVFTVVATLAFHLNLADQAESAQFMKNLAIIGGLLYVKTFGAGSMSVDSGKKPAVNPPASSPTS